MGPFQWTAVARPWRAPTRPGAAASPTSAASSSTAGYTQRYGLTYVDFATQKRTIKDSGYWYSRVAAAGRLDV